MPLLIIGAVLGVLSIIFLVACVLAFASGTSWGTFGILIPIVASIIATVSPEMFVPVVARFECRCL